MLKIVNFIISIVLARILEPSDFGLIALALIIVNFFDMFRQFGVGSALIYKREDIESAANTAFFIFPLLAFIFYAVSYAIAPIAADFFRDEQVEILIKVLSLTSVIWSFGSLPSALITKNLEFKKLMIPQILPKLGYGTVAIGMALNGFGVWSIVAGRFVLELLSVIALWKVINWRPLYKFDKKEAFELINYGTHVTMASSIVFLISVVDVTFIGRILGSESLGYYSIALSVTNMLTTQVSSIIGQVMFPVYSKIQDDKNALGQAYFKTINYLSLVTVPATFGIAITAWDFISVVYGNKWLPVVPALQVLCFYGMNRSILSTTENLYLAAGKPEIRTKLNLFQLILMFVFLYPLTMRYGILGASIAVMLPSTLIVFLTFREAGKVIEKDFSYIARSFVPSIKGSLIIIVAIYTWHYMSASFSPVFRLAFSIILGSSIYVSYLWLIRKDLFHEIRELITKR